MYWVLGCTIGALTANALSFNTNGMEFAATALFVVLLIEQWIKVKRLLPFIIAFIASGIALFFFIKHMLLVAIILSIGSIVLLRLIKTNSNE
jgi:4-azaleucine resistance transporter AzlC